MCLGHLCFLRPPEVSSENTVIVIVAQFPYLHTAFSKNPGPTFGNYRLTDSLSLLFLISRSKRSRRASQLRFLPLIEDEYINWINRKPRHKFWLKLMLNADQTNFRKGQIVFQCKWEPSMKTPTSLLTVLSLSLIVVFWKR